MSSRPGRIPRALPIAVAALLAAAVAGAHRPSAEVWIPAAARAGPWRTDLYLLNPGDTPLTATVGWLERGRPNDDPPTVEVAVPAGRSVALVDAIGDRFGLPRGEGALRIVADAPLVATCRIAAASGTGSVGQGFDGVPAAEALRAGDVSHIQGVAHDHEFRSNLYALAGADGAEVDVAVIAADGRTVASGSLSLGARQPFLARLPAVVGPLSVRDAAVEVVVRAGSAVVGASRIDLVTDDPTTLAGWTRPRAPTGPATLHGVILPDGAGAAGAIAVRLDAAGRAVGVELSYPSERCPVVFSAGRDLADDPVPPSDLAAGLEFRSTFDGGGEMAWILRLASDDDALVGDVEAVGDGFAGDAAGCNGPHGPREVRLGVR